MDNPAPQPNTLDDRYALRSSLRALKAAAEAPTTDFAEFKAAVAAALVHA